MFFPFFLPFSDLTVLKRHRLFRQFINSRRFLYRRVKAFWNSPFLAWDTIECINTPPLVSHAVGEESIDVFFSTYFHGFRPICSVFFYVILGKVHVQWVIFYQQPRKGLHHMTLVKGMITVFPKFRSYSVQWADKGGWRDHPTSFIPKFPNLPMVALKSWSVCHQVLLPPASGKYLYKYLYKPIAFTLASDI